MLCTLHVLLRTYYCCPKAACAHRIPWSKPRSFFDLFLAPYPVSQGLVPVLGFRAPYNMSEWVHDRQHIHTYIHPSIHLVRPGHHQGSAEMHVSMHKSPRSGHNSLTPRSHPAPCPGLTAGRNAPAASFCSCPPMQCKANKYPFTPLTARRYSLHINA